MSRAVKAFHRQTQLDKQAASRRRTSLLLQQAEPSAGFTQFCGFLAGRAGAIAILGADPSGRTWPRSPLAYRSAAVAGEVQQLLSTACHQPARLAHHEANGRIQLTGHLPALSAGRFIWSRCAGHSVKHHPVAGNTTSRNLPL